MCMTHLHFTTTAAPGPNGRWIYDNAAEAKAAADKAGAAYGAFVSWPEARLTTDPSALKAAVARAARVEAGDTLHAILIDEAAGAMRDAANALLQAGALIGNAAAIAPNDYGAMSHALADATVAQERAENLTREAILAARALVNNAAATVAP